MRLPALILLLTMHALPAQAQGDVSEPVESEPVELEPVSDEGAPAPEDLIAFAAAREAAGDGGLAIEALERFLEAYPFDPRSTEVTLRLAMLRKAPTRVTIESSRVLASVWIRGSRVAERTPAEVELPEGRHRIVVIARDGRRQVLDVVLPPASTRTVDVTFPGDFDPLERERFGKGEPLLVDAPKEETPDADARRKKRRVVALAGLSSAALVLGGVFGMMALSDAEEFRRAPSEDVARSGERAAILADVTLGVALVTGVTALVLRLKDREKKPAAVSLAPSIGAHGAGVVLRGGL